MDALFHDPELARFYDWDYPWSADFDWFLTLLQGAGSVLDLGCGTGIFSVAASRMGKTVVGIDPATAMLDIARSRDGGDRVTWVEASAIGLDLGRRFDAVIMTGHAFQSLLSAAERKAVFATIARHLAPGGRFFLDSRNPAARAWERWTKAATRKFRHHPDVGDVDSWIDAIWDAKTGQVSYETQYRLSDGQSFLARSRIAFPSLAELTAAIAEAGLRVDHWAGDAAGGSLHPFCPDFIPIGSLAA